jgi:L-threonylcarbamoyladenylate synthase
LPTETVYGLAADAANAGAVRRIFSAKGRPADHPLIVHLADAAAIDDWAEAVPAYAWRLAEAFWPGPMTLILRRRASVLDVVTGGLETVGLRVPSHPVAARLLRAFGGGVAAPSANRFGRVSPTTAADVVRELGERVDMVLDGGPCQIGLESTIVDASGEWPCILRPGAVTAEAITERLGAAPLEPRLDAPRAPGRMASHYAPETRVELASAETLSRQAVAALTAGLRVAVLVESLPAELSADRLGELARRLVHIPLPSDPDEAARRLYVALRRIDSELCDLAFVQLPDEAGLGAALADRMRKAAGQGA